MTDTAPEAPAAWHPLARLVGWGLFLATLVVVIVTGLALRHPWITPVYAAIIVASVVRSELSSRRESRRRRQAFSAAFHGSLDEVRAVLDVDHLRAVRDDEGPVQAVRQVRRQVPVLTLVQAVEVVRAL